MTTHHTATSLEQLSKKLVDERKKFFEEAFEGANPPERIRRAAENICCSFGIWGVCDPMYIANVIALEMGMGDGKSNFWVKGN